MYSTQSNNCPIEIDNPSLFGQEVAQMLKWLEQTNERSCNHWRQNIHRGLIEKFKNNANEYVCLANEIIPYAAKDEQAYYYGEALRKITGHASLLAYLVGRIGEEPTKEESLSLSKLDAMQALIWHISKGLPSEPPILIPVLASQFMFAHLNYVNEVGIIGIPLYALTSPYPDLPILWHEVGAYQVARDRTTMPSLKNHANNLKTTLKQYSEKPVWDLYRNAYKQSLLQYTPLKPEFVPYYSAVKESIESHIDKDSGWQSTWLGQILSDLFGLRALGNTMLKSLSLALARAYKRQDYTDLEHPEPKLRLQIAREYLRANHMLVLEAEQEESNETIELARTIIEYLRAEYPKRWSPIPPDDPIIQLVMQLVDDALAPQPKQNVASLIKLGKSKSRKGKDKLVERQHEGNTVLDQLSTNDALLAAFQECQEHLQTHVIEESELIWQLADFKRPIRAQIKDGETNSITEETLKNFRKISFMETDEDVPPLGQTVPPYYPK